MGRVVVVGLGPAGPELVTGAALSAIEAVPVRFLRTARHPSAGVVGGASSFDHLYEEAHDFAQVYASVVESLVGAAAEHGTVLYAVPGSPRVAERTVELLVADGRVDTEVVPGLSFLDLAWDRLGVDPVEEGARLVDGAEFALRAAGDPGPLLVGQCWSRSVLSGIKLAYSDPVPAGAVLLHHLGLPDERVVTVEWADIDRTLDADHLTSLWVPKVGSPPAIELVRLSELVRTLRDRCPWDREQTHHSLTRHLLEETYEVLEAIEELGDPPSAGAYAHLEEELGDLLFQVYFHATLAAEEGQFDLGDVARGIHDKLVTRHPHVFGDTVADTPEQVMDNWERIKRGEKGRPSLMDGIPAHLPALHHAAKIQRKAASVGFDWPDVEGPLAKVAEELAEVRAELPAGPPPPSPPAALTREVGDLLFAVVNTARHLNVDPEAALRASSAEFRRRFSVMEQVAVERGVDLADLDVNALEELWESAKSEL
ncbi:MAG TPA: nucleoside triphosphate pyrophosphohydrolase [Acidimicrobiales bacterium]|nr:nucleoside triphosphate pyrophosphohydrolase [Acidimicrobiales bacterium]